MNHHRTSATAHLKFLRGVRSAFPLAAPRSTSILLIVRNIRFKVIQWVPALVWMSLIFTGSGDALSEQHSSLFLEPVIRWLFPWFTTQGVDNAMFFIRKCGHTTEYAVLTVLLWYAINRTVSVTREWSWAQARAAFLVACLYAVSDELHQTLVPSRQGTLMDVLIDAFGAALGLLLISCAVALSQRRLATAMSA